MIIIIMDIAHAGQSAALSVVSLTTGLDLKQNEYSSNRGPDLPVKRRTEEEEKGAKVIRTTKSTESPSQINKRNAKQSSSSHN